MLFVYCFTGNIRCIMEGSCAGSSLTPAPVVHIWPTPSCLPPSLLSPMTMLTTRLCPLHAHQWWASTSPSPALTQVPCKPGWSTLSLQMSVKDHCLWGQHTGWPVRGGEAWSELMFSQRYRTASLWCCHINVILNLFSEHAPCIFLFLLQQQLGMCQPPRGRRPPTRSVAVQKEVCTFVPDGRTKTVMLVDAAQQTGNNNVTIV